MNLSSVPMLISGVLCGLLSITTWLFRRRERINRVFSFFTLALALDAIAFFLWFQFGSIDKINTWMRITFAAGFLVPLGLIFFFFAFTGYDQKMNARVLGIKVKHFKITMVLFIVICTLLAQFTNLLIRISDNPTDIWDLEFGPIGATMFPIYAGVFVYLFTMAYKSYKSTDNKPQKRFILLLSMGTLMWLLFGYIGAALVPSSSESWNTISYLGTSLMAVFYFVAIVNHQSDKVHELNIGLERKVQERTRQIQEKNSELEEALHQVQEMQNQVILKEKMATLGQLVAGLTHEINTPISAMRSMRNTKSKAVEKLQNALEKLNAGENGETREIKKIMAVILQADQLVDQGAERLYEILKNLKNFVRLDEAEKKMADIHEGLDSAVALIGRDMLKNIEVTREYGELPAILCHPRELNQVFLNLLMNARHAIKDSGRITISTSLAENMVRVAIADSGEGIKPADLQSIFDPGFTTKSSVVRASLGLSMCYRIIQEHRGKIEVESIVGEGSVFTVTLPLLHEPRES